MSRETVALLQLLIDGGIGLILFAIGIFMKVMRDKKAKKCTATVTGHVVKHRFYGKGHAAPIVKYTVKGKNYQVRRKFNGVVSKKIVKPGYYMAESGASVTERDYLHIPKSAITNLGAMAEELWPIDSEMTVYYNPDKPRKAYAERLPVGASLATIMFVIFGVCIIALAVLMYFVIHG